MSMKSHRFLGACFAVMLSLLIAACSANKTVRIATVQNASVEKVVDEKAARTVDCRNTNEYRFVIVQSPNRKNDSDPLFSKSLNIVVGDDVVSKIELPKESEV